VGELLERPDRLHGWIEAQWIRMVQSNKGERRLTRPARHKGWVPAAQRPPFVSTLFAIDRTGATASAVVPGRQVLDRLLEAALLRSLEPGFMIVARRSYGCPWERVSRALHGHFVDAHPGALALSNVHRYRKRFLGWLVRFKGVATRYLENYLAWERVLGRGSPFDFARQVLDWPHGRAPTQHFPRTEPEGALTPVGIRPRAGVGPPRPMG
jgi:hypothetical protein